MKVKDITISIITPLFNTPQKYLQEMIESVENQTCQNWQLCLADASDSEHGYVEDFCREKALKNNKIIYRRLETNGGISINSNACAKMATGNYIGILDHDDILHKNAIEETINVISQCDSEFVYTDEAKFTDNVDASFGVNYKPGFGMDELRAHNYICHFNVFSKKLFDEVGGYREQYDGSQDHDLVLRLCEKAKNIQHISKVLYYWRVHQNSVAMNISAKRYAIDAAVAAVQASLERNHESGTARNTIEGSRYKIDYDEQYAPKVSIWINSEDKQYVEYIIAQIEQSLQYRNFFFLISDKLKEEKYHYEHPIIFFDVENWSGLKEDSEYIVLVNPGIRCFSDDWLQEMLVLCQSDRVGCVGMKAVREDGILLHTRLIYDSGTIRVPYYGQNDGIEGYEAELTVVRNTSMLAGGVLLIKKSHYVSIQSICQDKTDFGELSLRLFLDGYRNVYTPFGCVAMAQIMPWTNVETCKKLWQESQYEDDPYYNRNLKYLGTDKEKKLPKLNTNHSRDLWKQRLAVAKELGIQSVVTLKNEGIRSLASKGWNFLQTRNRNQYVDNRFVSGALAYKDVLFISGCGKEVPHPHRYRVTHQKEQLESKGIHCEDVFYLNLSLEMVRYYTTFIFYRCPYTTVIGEFIRIARQQNKAVLYDVDDLVIDTKYTNEIPYVKKLEGEERELYDDGVKRMGKTLCLCDSVITTTKRLADELRQYVPESFINRNVASEEMLKCSEIANKQYELGQIDVVVGPKKKIKIVPDKKQILIGYFSGSITHNADFEMILPAIVKIMEKYSNVKLCVVGELSIPRELDEFANRIIIYPFVEYTELPKLIKSVDINIAPIEDTIFNEAKSENKWVEASLVKVPTIASNVGAFREVIEDYVTGILCDNSGENWYYKIEELIENEELRYELANNAYKYALHYYITTNTGDNLANYIKKKRAKTFAVVLPSTQISGGIMVALKHCEIMRKTGYNVLIIASNPTLNYVVSGNEKFPVIYLEKEPVEAYIEKMVATMWVTVPYVLSHPTTCNRFYLVQNYEVDFYELGRIERKMAFDTYNKKGFIKYITISKWCQKWLEEDFGQDTDYVKNGIDTEMFYPIKRDMSGKIRILIEGDSSVDYKNVDESFRITNALDKEKYEIWYLSYNGNPKDWYEYDRFIRKVPYNEMPHLYRQCDILLKTSILESFSYPPLEMMATGGYAVVAPNDGNREYLIHEKNCLLYEPGNIEDAIEKIERLKTDCDLQELLYYEGLKTAQKRDWHSIEEQIKFLYES